MLLGSPSFGNYGPPTPMRSIGPPGSQNIAQFPQASNNMTPMMPPRSAPAPRPYMQNAITPRPYAQGAPRTTTPYMQSGTAVQIEPMPQEFFKIPGFPPPPKPVAASEQKPQNTLQSYGSSRQQGSEVESPKKKEEPVGMIDIEKYSKLVGWDRLSRAPDDVVVGLLNAIYDSVTEMSDLTSEKRIHELVKLLKEYLTLLLVPTFEFQKYFEQYLNRLIKDQNWISMTTAQALCISVATPDDDSRLNKVNRKFFCSYCTLSYSSAKFTCKFCLASFKHVSDLQAHEFEAHNKLSSFLFVCEICQQSFPQNPMQLRDHMYERHICSRKHFECPYGCEKLILEMSQHSYKDHIKAVHQCSKCKDVVQGSMDEHNKMFHNEERARKRSPSPDRRKQDESRLSQGSHSRDRHKHCSERSHRLIEREPSDRGYDRDRDFNRGRGMERSRDYDEYEDKMKHASRGMEGSRRYDDIEERQMSPPRMIGSSRRTRGTEGFEKFNTSTIDDTELAKAQQTLREMQRAKELLEASENSFQNEMERFDYVDPPGKGTWPQCKTCKLQQPPGGFKCTKCNLVLSHRVFLFKHMQEVHKMLMPNSFECEMCPKVFSSLSILVYHVNKEAHACTSDHLQCTYGCLNLFQNKHSLDAHTNAKHEFMCHICEAPVVNQTKKRHFAIYHPGEKVTAPSEHQQTPMEQVEVATAASTPSHNEAVGKFPKTLTLAPRTHNNMRQSYLNLASNRLETLLFIPPPLLNDKSFASKTKTQLINMGFMHCRSCEIIYHPVLVSCKLCGETLLNNNCLNEHLVEVHKQKEMVGFKECAVMQCGAKLPNYKMLINHQVEHFCREHTECPFGCKQLIAGSESAVVQHCIQGHPNKEIPKFSTTSSERERQDNDFVDRNTEYVSLNKLHKESEQQSRSLDQSSDMDFDVCLKCITCSFMCFEDSMRTCDVCPADNSFKCGDLDELKWHLASFHDLFMQGEFVCVPCTNKNHAPVKFTDDVMRFLDHRHKAHGVCKVHERCSNSPCTAIFDPKSPDAERHVKFLCQFIKETTQPKISEGVALECTRWSMCVKCKFTAEITKAYECINCEKPKTFYVREEYYAHLVTAHSWKTEHIFSCFVCNSQFGSNAKAWLSHRQQNKSHSMCDQHVICDSTDCIWMAPNRSEIETHRRAQKCQDHKLDGIIRDTKICHVCSQIFSDGVIFQCVLCLKNKQQFVSVLEYLVHIENIHDRKIAGNFDCLECRSYTALSPYELSRHNYTKHKKCQSHKFCPNSSKCPVMFPFESYNMMHQCTFVNESPIKSLAESPSKSQSGRQVSVCTSLSDARKLTTVEMDVQDNGNDTQSKSIIISKINDKAVDPIDSPGKSESRTLGSNARFSGDSSKFFEGIGAPTHKPSEPVKVIRILPKTIINIDDDSPDDEKEKCREKVKETVSDGETRLPDRYQIAKEGKTKLYVCSHCNYRSILPPPGKFKGDMKCKQRNCGLIFHQKFELVSHLELAHDKPLPPVKFKITCEFCRDEKVAVPFAHNLSIPLCEHRKLVHGCCRTHIVCPVENCSTLLPTRDALEKHKKEDCCETLYVALEGEPSSSEKLDSWKKQVKSNSSEKIDSWGKRGESTSSEKSDSWSKRGESLSAWKKSKPSSDNPQVIDIDDDIPPPPKLIDIKTSKIETLVLKYGSKDSQPFKLFECLECARKFACMTIYRCNQCPDSISLSSRSFVNLVEFFAHLKDVHKIDTEIEHSCALCSSFRGPAYNLQKHVEQRHRVCGHHFLCPNMCKYLFDDKQKLLDHIQSGTCQGPSSSPSSGDKRKGADVFYEEDAPVPKKVFERVGTKKENEISRSKRSAEKGGSNKPPAKWDDMMANIVADIDGFWSDEDGTEVARDETDKMSSLVEEMKDKEMEVTEEEKADKDSPKSDTKNDEAENIEEMDPQKIVLVEEESPVKPVVVCTKPEDTEDAGNDEITENNDVNNETEENNHEQTDETEMQDVDDEQEDTTEKQLEEEEEDTEPEEEEDVVYEENSESDVIKPGSNRMTSCASAEDNPDDLIIDPQTEDEAFTVEFS